MDIVSAFVTLFLVVDPVGLGAMFLALTPQRSSRERAGVAAEACLIAVAILVGAALFGQWLLTVLSISMAAFRIAGGLLLLALAFEMVFGYRQSQASDDGAQYSHPGAFPLAVPLLAGPGAITAVILLRGRMEGDYLRLATLLGVIIVVLLLAYIIFRMSPLLGRILGPRGQVVFGRLLGVLLAALAVQYIADGVAAIRQ